MKLRELGIDAEVAKVEEALAGLIRLGYVESRRRRDAIYYSHDRSLGFRPRRSD
jgi:hypothetical protein